MSSMSLLDMCILVAIAIVGSYGGGYGHARGLGGYGGYGN